MATQHNKVRVTPGSDYRQREVVRNVGAEQRTSVRRVNSLVYLLFSVLVGLISIRVLLLLLAANPNNGFVNLIYDLTYPFVYPFLTVLGNPGTEGMVFEIGSIIAILVYSLLAWFVTKLLWILFYRSDEHVVTTYEEEV